MPTSYREDVSKQGAITLAIVVAIILVAWLLVWPKFSDWRNNSKELTLAQIDFLNRQKTLDAINRLVTNYQSKESQLSVLEASLPGAPKVPQLISNLEFLIINSDMKLTTFRVTDPTVVEQAYLNSTAQSSPEQTDDISAPKLVELKVEIGMEGEYTAFRGFLESLERNLRLFEVKSIAATPASGAGSGSGAVFSLVIGTSYQK